MTTRTYVFSWDKNTPLNELMTAHWHRYAEELFISCFEIYLADAEQKFSHDDEYSDVIGACAKPEELNLTPLIRMVELLAVTWRQETKWGNLDRLYGDEIHTQKILDDWFKWLKQIPRGSEKENPEILSHIVKAVAFRTTDRGEMICRNLRHLMEKHYLEPVLKTVERREYWIAQENEWREIENSRGEERKARYAKRSIIGKIGLFLSELWESEKDAWSSHKSLKKADYKELLIGVGGLILLAIFILFFVGGIITLTGVFGFSFYVGHGDEAPARVALYAVMAASFALFFFVLLIFFYIKNDHRASEEIRLQAKKDIKSWLLGSLYCLIYGCISIVIDWVTGNYLYGGAEVNSLLQMILLCVYGGAVFFTFYFWAKSTKFGPFSEG